MRYEKGEFVTVPNKHKLRELTLGARAVFVEICDFADENGRCFPSRKLLAERIQMHTNSVDRFLQELVENGLLERSMRIRSDGSQTSNEYQILVVGVTTDGEGGIPTDGEAELYPVLTQPTSGEAQLRVESYIPGKEDIEARPRGKSKYPHAKEVFSWFPKPEKNWQINTTELSHAELLYERGKEKVKGAISYILKHKDETYCPQITKPSDLERKWNDLIEYANRNEL